MEERVLTIFEATFSTSTCAVAYEMGISQPVVWRIVHEECMPFYHVQKVQYLHTDNCLCRADFVQWMKNNNPRFPALILFRDKAKFIRKDIFRMRNLNILSISMINILSDSNPHCTIPHKHQQKFSMNIWASIFGDFLVGPCIMPVD